jgi:glutamate-1-semialdehyde 2,1-aminomutase
VTSVAASELTQSPILERYLERTPRSAALMERARAAMPAGSTRTFGYFDPYPMVFERGEGVHLWDVDGHRHIDFTYNGLSLIHGHAYPPVLEALRTVLPRGTAWPGSSIDQIEFAELLCRRIPHTEQVRFTNTGTEATMLGVKLARHATGRPLIVKFRGAYHGSYDDLEAGLYGIGELEGRTLLGDFGDISSFERVFAAHADEIAAVVIEPILFTFRVIPPPENFLSELIDLAHQAGILAVLDDCLMFRLAEGGSAERYGLHPDITCLGKFVGGGLPVGAIASTEELMSIFDPAHPRAVYHGGSFNGNPLGCAAGKVAMERLTATEIQRMDAQAERLAAALAAASESAGVPLEISGDGSILGVHVIGDDGKTDHALSRRFHLAAINRGVYFGQDGEFALATPFTDDDVTEAIELLELALADLASEIEGGSG